MPLCANVNVLVVNPRPQLAPGSCPKAELKLDTNSSLSGDGPASTLATRNRVAFRGIFLRFFTDMVIFTAPGLAAVALICVMVCFSCQTPSLVFRRKTWVVAFVVVTVVAPQ